MEIFSITTNVSRYGGAQKVMLDVHRGIKAKHKCYILGFQKFEDIHPKYEISREEYVQFTNPWQLNDKIVLVHARNVIPLIVTLSKFLTKNTKVVYISHNVYSTHRWLTLFPKTVVSISRKVTENLINYFKVPSRNIRLIFNGISDTGDASTPGSSYHGDKIRILYPARVNSIKRQVELVQQLDNKLSSKVEIHFAGVGDDYEQLQKLCSESNHFRTLGFVTDMHNIIPQYDYVMLYSIQEGLPIALLEAIMLSKPLLVNDVGGNIEIGIPGSNAFLLTEDWNKLAEELNKLENVTLDAYQSMCRFSRDHFVKNFRVENMVEKYLQLISDLKSES